MRGIRACIGAILLLALVALGEGSIAGSIRQWAARAKDLVWSRPAPPRILALQRSRSLVEVLHVPIQEDGRYSLEQKAQPMAHLRLRFYITKPGWPADWRPISLALRPTPLFRGGASNRILLPIVDFSEISSGSSRSAAMELNLTVALPAAGAMRVGDYSEVLKALYWSRRGELKHLVGSRGVARKIDAVDCEQRPVLFTPRPLPVGATMSATVVFYLGNGGLGRAVESHPILVRISGSDRYHSVDFNFSPSPSSLPLVDYLHFLYPNVSRTLGNARASLDRANAV